MKRLRFLEGIKHFKFTRAVNYALIGSLVVIVGTFAAWQFTKIFAPSSLINSNDPEIRLNTSDHDLGDALLPNNMADTTRPKYEGTEQVHLLPIIGGAIKVPRIQGEVWYR